MSLHIKWQWYLQRQEQTLPCWECCFSFSVHTHRHTHNTLDTWVIDRTWVPLRTYCAIIYCICYRAGTHHVSRFPLAYHSAPFVTVCIQQLLSWRHSRSPALKTIMKTMLRWQAFYYFLVVFPSTFFIGTHIRITIIHWSLNSHATLYNLKMFEVSLHTISKETFFICISLTDCLQTSEIHNKEMWSHLEPSKLSLLTLSIILYLPDGLLLFI